MDDDRPYWNMEVETKLNTPEMREIQLAKLKKMLARLNDNAPFYNKQFDRAGSEPGQDKQLRGVQARASRCSTRKA